MPAALDQGLAERGRARESRELHAVRGLPERWSASEYSTYFETIFGDDRERQRAYITAMLAADRVRLAVGNRVFGAMMATGLCRTAFTANFDPVAEKAVAEVAGEPLAPYLSIGAQTGTGIGVEWGTVV